MILMLGDDGMDGTGIMPELSFESDSMAEERIYWFFRQKEDSRDDGGAVLA